MSHECCSIIIKLVIREIESVDVWKSRKRREIADKKEDKKMFENRYING